MVDLIFKLFVAQVAQLLKCQHPEHHYWVNSFAASITLPILGIALHEQKAEELPGNKLFDSR